jgi:hypothetical protein
MNFDKLYARALSEWPKEIKFGQLRHYNVSNQTYSTRDLWLLCEEITERNFNSADEVLINHLHDAIYIILHDLAGHCTNIKMSQVRKESVRSKFETRLISANRIAKKLKWTDDDRKLVSAYLKKAGKQTRKLNARSKANTAK